MAKLTVTATLGNGLVMQYLTGNMARTTKRIVIVGTLVTFVAFVTIYSLGLFDIGLTKYRQTDVFEANYISAIPADWQVFILLVIAPWNLAWIIYAQTTLCRRAKEDNSYLYQRSVYSPYVFVFTSIAHLFGIAYVFLIGNEFLIASLIGLLLYTASMLVALYLSIAPLVNQTQVLRCSGLTTDLWLIRGLIQSGIGLDAFWAAHLLLAQLGMVMTYADGYDETNKTYVDPDVSTTVVLSLVAATLSVWFVLDLGVFKKATQYLLTPYVTFIVYSAAVLEPFIEYEHDSRTMNWNTNSIFSVVLLTVASVLAFIKVTVTLVYAFKKPIYPTVQ